MKRRIVAFGKYFGEFLDTLTVKEREKVDYGLVMLKTQDRLSSKFVKHIREGLYELSIIVIFLGCFSFLMKIVLWFCLADLRRRQGELLKKK